MQIQDVKAGLTEKVNNFKSNKKAKCIAAGVAAGVVATGAAYLKGKSIMNADSFDKTLNASSFKNGKPKFLSAIKEGFKAAFNKITGLFKKKDNTEKTIPDNINNIKQEALRRTEAEKQLKQARRANDIKIKKQLNPSGGKSAQKSAAIFGQHDSKDELNTARASLIQTLRAVADKK